jgi:hypothetical protein
MKYVVWIGGIDNWFSTWADAWAEVEMWVAKGYDDIWIETVSNYKNRRLS